jgi:hypothetical protein
MNKKEKVRNLFRVRTKLQCGSCMESCLGSGNRSMDACQKKCS